MTAAKISHVRFTAASCRKENVHTHTHTQYKYAEFTVHKERERCSNSFTCKWPALQPVAPLETTGYTALKTAIRKIKQSLVGTLTWPCSLGRHHEQLTFKSTRTSHQTPSKCHGPPTFKSKETTQEKFEKLLAKKGPVFPRPTVKLSDLETLYH